MARIRSRVVETESVNQRMLRRGAVKRQHISPWAVGHDELAPGVVGDTHLHPTAVERVREVAAGAGVGQLLVVSATGASFASGGAYVTADSIVYQLGFGVIAAGDSIVWPHDAVGEIQVEFKWDTYEGGGTIEIEVDGSVPAWGLIGEGTEGSEGCKRRSVHIAEGSVVKVKVTQASGVAQTADVLLEFSIPDPAVAAPSSASFVETIWVDSRTASASSVAALESDSAYTLVVEGNARIHVEGSVDTGSPDDVMYPSPGQPASSKAEYDADTVYAYRAVDAPALPGHAGSFELNLGSGWAHVEPVDGPFTSPQSDHLYTFQVTGQGSVLQARFVDAAPADNNGQFKVAIYEGW